MQSNQKQRIQAYFISHFFVRIVCAAPQQQESQASDQGKRQKELWFPKPCLHAVCVGTIPIGGTIIFGSWWSLDSSV